jgi:hypothetical protein
METLLRLFAAAIRDLNENDAVILKNQTREESINHRLASYLERHLSTYQSETYNVDIEYDKHGDDKKENIYKKEFRPDIIIHRRMVDEHNYVYVEAKKSPKPSEILKDEKRIRLAISPPYNYTWGVRIQYGNGTSKTKLKSFWRGHYSRIEEKDLEL